MYYQGISDQKFREIIASVYQYKCQYCLRVFNINNLQVDHIYPKSLGGPNELFNYTLSCDCCNRIKSNQILHEAAQNFLQMWATIKSKDILTKINLLLKVPIYSTKGVKKSSYKSNKFPKGSFLNPHAYGNCQYFNDGLMQRNHENHFRVYKKMILSEFSVDSGNSSILILESKINIEYFLNHLEINFREFIDFLKWIKSTYVKLKDGEIEALCLRNKITYNQKVKEFSTIKMGYIESIHIELNYISRIWANNFFASIPN